MISKLWPCVHSKGGGAVQKSSEFEAVFPNLNFKVKFPFPTLKCYIFKNKISLFEITREISRKNYSDWQHRKIIISTT